MTNKKRHFKVAYQLPSGSVQVEDTYSEFPPTIGHSGALSFSYFGELRESYANGVWIHYWEVLDDKS